MIIFARFLSTGNVKADGFCLDYVALLL